MKAKNTVIGLLVIIAWLPLLVRLYGTFPVFINTGIELELSKMEASIRDVITATYGSVENYISQLKLRNWIAWAVTLLALACGVGSGVLARKATAGWRPAVIVMSGIFVVGYIFELFRTAGDSASIGMIIDVKTALANATLKSGGQIALVAFIATEVLFLGAFFVHCLVVILTASVKGQSGSQGLNSKD